MRRAVLVLLAGALLAAPAVSFAQRQQVPIGVRAIALGGTFSSTADDVSAIFWNPAGLVRIGHQEISGTHTNLYGVDLVDNDLAFLLPITPRHAVALDWHHAGTADDALDFGENRFDLGYAFGLHPKLSLGGSVKLLTRSQAQDGTNVPGATGFGIDLGFLAGPFHGFRFGLVGQDLTDTRIHYADNQGSALALPQSVRAAVSYAYRDLGMVGLDVDDRVHLGAEVLPVDLLALRAGLQADPDGREDPVWSFGAGFKAGIFRFDYAYEIHPVLANTSHFGISMAFQFNPAQIRIEKVETRELYTSLYKTYAEEPVGTVRVRNLADGPLTARLAVFVPGIMDTPTEREVILRPKAVQEIPITLVLPEKVMSGEEDRPVQIRVAASYRSARVERSDKATGKTVLYAPGAINWGEGVDQAAAFVTARDPVVAAVARQASRTAIRMEDRPFPSRNIAFAAAMFEALNDLGLAYVPDPNNPYQSISETAHAVDTIHYPRETLQKRVGDCDDTSVLMSSMLENVGVPTKLVDVPGHIMILVGTGVDVSHRLGLAVDDVLLVTVDDELWIPVETTALGETFFEAWSRGARAYHDWDARGRVNLVDVARAQSRYEPALPVRRTEAPSLDPDALRRRLEADSAEFLVRRREYLAGRFGEAARSTRANPAGINELAQVYLAAGKPEEARRRLEAVLGIAPGNSATNNNLAVVYVSLGELAVAVEHLRTALQQAPEDPGIRVNLARVLWELGDADSARAVLAEAETQAGGFPSLLSRLGLEGAPAVKGAEEGSRERLLDREPAELPLYWKR